MHIRWSVCARQVGTQGPSVGHRQTKLRALIARIVGIEYPKRRTIFGHFMRLGGFDFMMMLYSNFVILRWRFCDAFWRFCDASMPISWYFYHIYDTLMILFCKIIRKVPFIYIIIYQILTLVFNQKDDTLRLFSRKNFFSCAYKLDGKSEKYLIWNLIDSPKITPRRRLYYMAT